MLSDEGKDALTGKTARVIALVVIVFVNLWLVRDPTDRIWGAPGSGLQLFASFTEQGGAPVLAGAEGTASSEPEPAPEPEPAHHDPAHHAHHAATADGGPSHASHGRPAALSDPDGRGLAHLHESLRAGGRTRVLHYGDSLIDTDFVVGTARRLMQDRFGDGGHGFLNAGKPWTWYRHWDVVHSVRGGWTVSVATHSRTPDRRYGLGGASFRLWGGTATFATAPEGDHGRKVSRFEVSYVEQPGGGTMILAVDGREERVSTAGPALVPRWKELAVPDGAHTLVVRSAGDGEVRVYGVVMERERGVVYDGLGINGARVRILADFDEASWAEQLRHRAPDLVILGFGLNEAEAEHFPVGHWPELGRVVERLRAAVPEASCLLMGPPDRVDREGNAYRSRAVVGRITRRQREVALEHGCAYFDLQAAMGGEGAAARWAKLRPRLVAGDLTHPTPEGAERIGEMLVEALTAGM